MSTQKTAILIILALYAIPSYALRAQKANDIEYKNDTAWSQAYRICTDDTCTDCVLPSREYRDAIGEFTETCNGTDARYNYTQNEVQLYRLCGKSCANNLVDRGDGMCVNKCPPGRSYIEDGRCVDECSSEYPYVEVEQKADEESTLTLNQCKKACSSDRFLFDNRMCVDLSENGKNIAYKGLDGISSDNGKNLADGHWTVEFSYGTVEGLALCEPTSGTLYAGTSSISVTQEGNNCWCRPIGRLGGVLVGTPQESISDCAAQCAQLCAVHATNEETVRENMWKLVCRSVCASGEYSIGGICVDPETSGNSAGFYEINETESQNLGVESFNPGEWGVKFSDDTIIRGTAVCNDNVAVASQYGTTTRPLINTTEAKRCWCKMTSPAASAWVHAFMAEGAECAGSCASECTNLLMGKDGGSSFRTAMYSSVSE